MMVAYSSKKMILSCLPDGTEFPFWKDETNYRKIYYVDQQHPEAADNNPGTENAPFLTIQRSAETLNPGEKVLIKSGIYREWIRPIRGGTSLNKMISFESAPGAKAIIRGSQLLDVVWKLSNWPDRVSINTWMTDLPHSFFKDDHPFALANTTEKDFEVMRWANSVRGQIPHTLRRAIVFQNGRRLTQLATYGDIPRVSGSFWVDSEKYRLHINPFDHVDPNTCQFEVTTQQYLFNPMVKGLGYIRIKGLIFEHAGNGFVRSGNGAINTWSGNHWIIQDNTARHINSVAIEIGAWTNEHIDRTISREKIEQTTGGHIVCGNKVYDCGTGGIQGTVVPRSLVAHNHIYDCGWQEAETYWETAGIKILYTNGSLVQENHIHHCYACKGIWIDFQNRNSRVCRNLIHDISCYHGAIFFEASNVLNLIDHNIVYRVQGSGIYQHDCDQLLIAHNLVGNCSNAGIQMLKTKDRDRVGFSRHNKVINNVITDCKKPVDYFDLENISDKNIFSNVGEDFNLEKLQIKNLDIHSRIIDLQISIDPKNQNFSWSSKTNEILKVSSHKLLKLDYFGRLYPDSEVSVGPFTEGWSQTRRQLELLNSKP